MGEKYSGWANYETWCVALWIDNDEAALGIMLELAGEAVDSRELGDRIEANTWVSFPFDGEPDMFSDLLRAALGEVDWRELGEHYIEKAGERSA